MIEPLDARYEFSSPHGSGRKWFWLRQTPYLAALVLTLGGVGYTSVANQPLAGYWQFMALFMGVVCISAGWTAAREKDALVQLIWTQAVHWVVFLVAMNLVLLPSVQRMTDADTIGLTLLLLLALATFISGIHTLSWQICLLGAFMALCVPGIAWLENSVLFLFFGGACVMAVIAFIWWRSRD